MSLPQSCLCWTVSLGSDRARVSEAAKVEALFEPHCDVTARACICTRERVADNHASRKTCVVFVAFGKRLFGNTRVRDGLRYVER
ncbi:MAG: hypothetical protein RL701_3061 [Pseudomonadota bacterium]|jgi:hypothetical protein